jgi:hypothetical protein
MRTKRTKPSDKTHAAQDAVAIRTYLPLRECHSMFAANEAKRKDAVSSAALSCFMMLATRMHDTAHNQVFTWNDIERERGRIFDDTLDRDTLAKIFDRYLAFLASANRLRIIEGIDAPIYVLI